MTAERWRKVEELYHAASERRTGERAAFLAEACSDEDLRREVEELLQQSEATENLLDRPALQLLDQPDVQIGQTLGPYRIAALIGSGGMGRVYRAFDTRLGRFVAIKVSRAGFTGRFRREARAIAALSHPHICTLYDLGPNYLVMEYIEGVPIKGPMPLPEALKIAIAIADALDAAHRKGVIHRDLKPANILLTESGPKLLDFGLAKQEPSPESGAPDSTTWASTAQATIAGTLQYMSPEQLQGRRADVRSDIFSFGAVLFEMLTGHPAFEADNSASLIAAILTSQPKARKFVPHLPEEVERVLDRALAKDPKNRWQSARDLKTTLAWIATPPKAASSPDRAAWVLAAFFAFVAAAVGWMHWGPDVGSRLELAAAGGPDSRTPQLLMFDRTGRMMGAAGAPADYSNPAVSPDGERLAVSIRDSNGKRDIWILNLTGGGQTQLSSDPADETNPVWSPDGREIVYCSDRSGPRDLYARDSSGGPERLLLSSSSNKNPLDWTKEDSTIYYNVDRDGGGHDIWMLPLAGQEPSPREFLRVRESRDWLALSPDSRWLLYRTGSSGNRHVRLRPVLSGWSEFSIGADGVPEGHWRGDGKEIYYISGDAMMAQTVETAGTQVKLGTPTRLFRVPKPNTFGRNAFVVTPDGKHFVIRTGR